MKYAIASDFDEMVDEQQDRDHMAFIDAAKSLQNELMERVNPLKGIDEIPQRVALETAIEALTLLIVDRFNRMDLELRAQAGR